MVLYTSARDGDLAQLGERLPYKQRVSGSSPLTSTKKSSIGRWGFFLFRSKTWFIEPFPLIKQGLIKFLLKERGRV